VVNLGKKLVNKENNMNK